MRATASATYDWLGCDRGSQAGFPGEISVGKNKDALMLDRHFRASGTPLARSRTEPPFPAGNALRLGVALHLCPVSEQGGDWSVSGPTGLRETAGRHRCIRLTRDHP